MCESVKQLDKARKSLYYTPRELRTIRRHLLSSNKMYELMVWVIILVGVKEFLRIEETLSMEMAHFQPPRKPD